ncbi:MAG: M1 family metallopeptidase, partial [Ardenticatenaceae bacterium]
VNMDTSRALSLDGLKNSHPIEQEVKHPSEIEQLFDAISYSKGGSILRMLEQFLGEETFRNGLHQYLTEHQYANATTRDLWDALGDASGQPVATLMDSWVMQTGYPVLDADIARRNGSATVSVSQNRFVYESISGTQEQEDTLWYVPVSAKSASNQQPVSRLMDAREDALDVALASADEWVKLNHLHTGFYRVKYVEEELQKLTEPIRRLELPSADRLGIQNDAYALVRAGLIPATQFLTVAEAYKNETDATVCADLASNLGSLDNLLWDEGFYKHFQAFARSIFKPIGDRVGWEARPGEGHLDVLLRSTVLGQLGDYEDEGTLREAAAQFAKYVENPAHVRPDIRSVVYSLAGKTGDRAMYDKMWELRNRAPLQEEKVRFMMGLSQFQQPDMLKETLERALGSEVRVHDTITFVIFVAGNRHGRDLAWRFLKENWAEFDRRYGEGGFGLMRLVSIVSGFTTPEMHEDVERFFRDHPAPAAERS